MNGALYRRFRPDTFDQVIGQDHIVRTLKNQIESGNLSHAYLFTGTRGTGKTSTAKIFARAVNCEHPVGGSACGACPTCAALKNPANLDVVEIDAASNNGVDEIRELIENARYRPSVGKYKVYIVDEVHMLSTSAFNALLKTLEEPPAHVVFILATTEAHKLPQTVLSRCIRFDFRLVSDELLTAHLKRIFDEIGQEYDEAALRLVARHGEGSVRDTLSAADMLVAYANGKITAELAERALGSTSFDALSALCEEILGGETGKALARYEAMTREGKNPQTLAKDLGSFFLDVLFASSVSRGNLAVTDGEFARLQALSEASPKKKLTHAIRILTGLEGDLRYTAQPKLLVGAAIVDASEAQTDVSGEATLSRLAFLEREVKRLKEGGFVAKVTNKVESEGNAPKEVPKPEISDKVKELLAGAKAVGIAPIFKEQDDAEEKTRNEQRVRNQRLWSGIRDVLKERNELTLSAAAGDVTEVLLKDGVFEVKTPSKQAYELLTDAEHFAIMQEIVWHVVGQGTLFRVFPVGGVPKISRSGEDDKRALRELFGSSLIKK